MGTLTTGGVAQVSVPLGFGEQYPAVRECPGCCRFRAQFRVSLLLQLIAHSASQEPCEDHPRRQSGKPGPCHNSHRAVLWAAPLCRSGLSPTTHRRLKGAPYSHAISLGTAASNSSLGHKMTVQASCLHWVTGSTQLSIQFG